MEDWTEQDEFPRGTVARVVHGEGYGRELALGAGLRPGDLIVIDGDDHDVLEQRLYYVRRATSRLAVWVGRSAFEIVELPDMGDTDAVEAWLQS